MPYELWLTKKLEQRHTKPRAKPVLRFPIELKRISRVSSLLKHEIHIDTDEKAEKLNKYHYICIVDTDIDIVFVSRDQYLPYVKVGDSNTLKWNIEFPFVEEKWLRDVCKSELVNAEEEPDLPEPTNEEKIDGIMDALFGDERYKNKEGDTNGRNIGCM